MGSEKPATTNDPIEEQPTATAIIETLQAELADRGVTATYEQLNLYFCQLAPVEAVRALAINEAKANGSYPQPDPQPDRQP